MTNETTLDRINACIIRSAHGTYQRDILCGRQRISGSDLCGAAKQYTYHYAMSRRAVIHRFSAAVAWEFDNEYSVEIHKTNHGLRYLVIVDNATNDVVWAA